MRPEKKSIVDEYSQALKSTDYVFLTDYRGLTVEQFADLRKQLREVGSSMQVVKNGMFTKALDGSDWANLTEVMDGPTAIICGDGDVTDVAKKLTSYRKKNERPVMTAGKVDGMLLTSADIDEMAKIPPREILLGKFVGTVAAPMTQFVGVLNQKVASILYVLKAIEEKKNS